MAPMTDLPVGMTWQASPDQRVWELPAGSRENNDSPD